MKFKNQNWYTKYGCIEPPKFFYETEEYIYYRSARQPVVVVYLKPEKGLIRILLEHCYDVISYKFQNIKG